MTTPESFLSISETGSSPKTSKHSNAETPAARKNVVIPAKAGIHFSAVREDGIEAGEQNRRTVKLNPHRATSGNCSDWEWIEQTGQYQGRANTYDQERPLAVDNLLSRGLPEPGEILEGQTRPINHPINQ